MRSYPFMSKDEEDEIERPVHIDLPGFRRSKARVKVKFTRRLDPPKGEEMTLWKWRTQFLNNPEVMDKSTSARKCEQCQSAESTGTVLKWYWDDERRPHLLCELCARRLYEP